MKSKAIEIDFENLEFGEGTFKDDEIISVQHSEKKLIMHIKHIIEFPSSKNDYKYKCKALMLIFKGVSKVENIRPMNYFEIFGFHKKEEKGKLKFEIYIAKTDFSATDVGNGKPLKIVCESLEIDDKNTVNLEERMKDKTLSELFQLMGKFKRKAISDKEFKDKCASLQKFARKHGLQFSKEVSEIIDGLFSDCDGDINEEELRASVKDKGIKLLKVLLYFEDDGITSAENHPEKKELILNIKHISEFPELENGVMPADKYKYTDLKLIFKSVSKVENFRSINDEHFIFDIIGFHKKEENGKLNFEIFVDQMGGKNDSIEPLKITCDSWEIEELKKEVGK